MTTDVWVDLETASYASGVKAATIRVWATRDTVRTRGDGRSRKYHLGDVLQAERAWRERAQGEKP